jgi:hypothetical protein
MDAAPLARLTRTSHGVLTTIANRIAHSIPDLNINNFICFQRLTDRNPEQRICLA